MKIIEKIDRLLLNESGAGTSSLDDFEDEWVDMGIDAFKRGVKRAPMLDVILMKAIEGAPGNKARVFKLWTRGWDKANMKDIPTWPLVAPQEVWDKMWKRAAKR